MGIITEFKKDNENDSHKQFFYKIFHKFFGHGKFFVKIITS